jgi:hypothetical protein
MAKPVPPVAQVPSTRGEYSRGGAEGSASDTRHCEKCQRCLGSTASGAVSGGLAKDAIPSRSSRRLLRFARNDRSLGCGLGARSLHRK